MSNASNIIAGVLGLSVFDVTDEYAQLLEDWYGDDLSLLDYDDDDLATAVNRLTRSIAFWRTNPNRLSPYEKLSLKYEALIEQHRALLDVYHEAQIIIADLRTQQRTTTIQTRCVSHKHSRRSPKERRGNFTDKSAA